MQNYIIGASFCLFCLSLAAAVILYTNPETFRVKPWVKGSGYLAFIIDIAGGLVGFMWATLNLPDAFLEAAFAMVITSGCWVMATFIYVHAFVIPAHRGAKE